MMNAQVESWFPTPLYAADGILLDRCNSLEGEVNQILKKYPTQRTGSLNVDSVHQEFWGNGVLDTFPEFCLLKEEIQRHVEEFLSRLNMSDYDIRITNMWFNVSDKGDYNFPHTHCGSVISGVYYICSPQENFLRLYNPNYMTFNFPVSPVPNEYTYNYCDVPCIPGRLLMFPSHLQHGNPMQEVEGKKIAVSFNTRLG